LDLRREQNAMKRSGTAWANCGPSQFHLPNADMPQVIPESIRIAYHSLQSLKEHLTKDFTSADDE